MTECRSCNKQSERQTEQWQMLVAFDSNITSPGRTDSLDGQVRSHTAIEYTEPAGFITLKSPYRAGLDTAQNDPDNAGTRHSRVGHIGRVTRWHESGMFPDHGPT